MSGSTTVFPLTGGLRVRSPAKVELAQAGRPLKADSLWTSRPNGSRPRNVYTLDMKQLLISRTSVVLLGLFLSSPSAPPRAQTRQAAPDDALFRTVASLDTRLFDAYNTCNLERFASFFVEDVEFYHDEGGVTRGRSALVDSIKSNICGKTRRDLIPGTLEVHPMDGYGALQMGAHRFCDAARKGCDATGGGVGKFIHLWQNTNGAWKITRVISYDHAPAVK